MKNTLHPVDAMVPLLTVLVVLICFLTGCESKRLQSGLEGVWKVDRVVDLTTMQTLPAKNSHYMFTAGHIMTFGGKEDRPVVGHRVHL